MSIKPNLVIIHSFPTNSILLQGLKSFLESFFKVYIIDLPGFVKAVKPLKVISFDNYARYVESEIERLRLDKYIIGGISFGFIVVLKMRLDARCKGIFGIEPYIGRSSLSTKRSWKYTIYPIISLIDMLDLSNIIWQSRLFRVIFSKIFLRDLSSDILNIILTEIDGKTFVKTLKLILITDTVQNFHSDLPHVLFINKQDTTLQCDYLEDIFKRKIKSLLIVEETVSHFPNDLSKEFFSSHFANDLIIKSIDFINGNS